MASLSQMFGGGIKSVQRGSLTLPDVYDIMNVTISPVNTQKAFCNLLNGSSFVDMRLTSSTNLRFSGKAAVNGESVSWEVIEFY